MITVTITSADDKPFTVRFQTKALKDGAVVWRDDEIIHETGKSQPYGFDKNFRLIVEAGAVETSNG